MPFQIIDNNHDYGTLQNGDLVFKNCANKLEVGKLIQVGQALSTLWSSTRISDAKWEHAAISTADNGQIIEAVANGVTIDEMTNTADYIVFRCNHEAVATAASETAKMILQSKLDNPNASFDYSVKKAVKSLFTSSGTISMDAIDQRLDQLFPVEGQAGDTRVFCSQFVALCFQIGAHQHGLRPEDFILIRDHAVTPAQLVSYLRDNAQWTLVGISGRGTH